MAKPIKTVTTVVTRVEELGNTTKRLTLADEDGWDLPPFRPGAHIDVHLKRGLVRTYSLCNEPEDNRRYVIAVKREADGRGGSQHLHDVVKEGDRLGVSIPRGGIALHPTEMNVFVAGGIGVTPFLSAIRHLDRNGRSNYQLHWISRGAPMLPDMIATAIEAGRVRLYDTTRQDKLAIAGVLKDFAASGHAACCGPDGMLDAFSLAVEAWPEDRKHIEMFTPPKRVPLSDLPPYKLILSVSNQQVTVLPEVGLLGTLEALDVDVPVSCAGGVCGSCRTRWTEGPPIHRDRVLTPAERQTEMIVCVGECSGARLVLEL